MGKFLSGLGESAFGNGSAADVFCVYGLEKIIQFILERAFDHIHKKENHLVEREAACSRTKSLAERRWQERKSSEKMILLRKSIRLAHIFKSRFRANMASVLGII